MYKPSFNTVLVEIDDADAKWGGENNEHMLGASYKTGTLLAIGKILPTKEYPFTLLSEEHTLYLEEVEKCLGKPVMWNLGEEASSNWEEDGKKYGLIYWHDIRGVRE